MIYSRKPRLKVVADDVPAASPMAGLGVNDNIPGMVAGHEMSDLIDAPRQPAAETVAHYARVSQIGSFPDDHSADQIGTREPPVLESQPEGLSPAAGSGKTKVTLACIVSVFVHIAVFSFLVFAMVAEPEEPIEEAGAVVSVTLLGDSEFDQMAVGDPEVVEAESVEPEMLQPTEVRPEETTPVETAEAEPVEAEQPVETTPTQPVETVETQPVETVQTEQVSAVQPTEPLPDVVESEPVVALEPQVLTSLVPTEPTVVQPVASQLPETVETVEPTVTAIQPVEEKIEPVEKPVEKPVVKKPVAKKPVSKPKPKVAAEKPKQKKPKAKAGSGGDQAQDQKKGTADGSDSANANTNGSKSAGKQSASGSAAVANYPGKVQSRIRRSVRVPTAFKKMSATVRVRLTIGSSGSLSGLSVVRSSGVPELDRAVVDGVRRASPFPPLPSEWGKPSWSFTQEVQVGR